jgi:hypothetical protein
LVYNSKIPRIPLYEITMAKIKAAQIPRSIKRFF